MSCCGTGFFFLSMYFQILCPEKIQPFNISLGIHPKPDAQKLTPNVFDHKFPDMMKSHSAGPETDSMQTPAIWGNVSKYEGLWSCEGGLKQKKSTTMDVVWL